MLIRPTSVAAVICHALSPELSQLAYGFNPASGASLCTAPPRRPHPTIRCCNRLSHKVVSAAFPVCYAPATQDPLVFRRCFGPAADHGTGWGPLGSGAADGTPTIGDRHIPVTVSARSLERRPRK